MLFWKIGAKTIFFLQYMKICKWYQQVYVKASGAVAICSMTQQAYF